MGVCREPAPDQQPDAGGNNSAAMPGGAGQAGAPAARPLEHPPVLPPERRDQGTLCPGRRLPGPPAGKGFCRVLNPVKEQVKNEPDFQLPAFQIGFCTYAGLFYAIFSFILVPIFFHFFVSAKSDQDPDPDPHPHGSALI